MKIIKTLLFSLIFFTTYPLSAAFYPTPPVSESLLGPYIEGNLGSGIVSETAEKSWAFAGNANIGYQFHPNFAIEAGYNQVANSDNSWQARNFYAFDIALKSILPLTQRISLYSKLGAAAVHHTNIIFDGFRPTVYYGGGFSFDAYKNFSLNLGATGTVERRNFEVPKMLMLTAGVAYKFW